MDRRERLAMTLHLASEETDRMKWYAAIKWVEESGYAPEWRTLQQTAYRQADAILASDWLRDTLAAAADERQAAIVARLKQQIIDEGGPPETSGRGSYIEAAWRIERNEWGSQ